MRQFYKFYKLYNHSHYGKRLKAQTNNKQTTITFTDGFNT